MKLGMRSSTEMKEQDARRSCSMRPMSLDRYDMEIETLSRWDNQHLSSALQEMITPFHMLSLQPAFIHSQPLL